MEMSLTKPPFKPDNDGEGEDDEQAEGVAEPESEGDSESMRYSIVSWRRSYISVRGFVCGRASA